MVASAIRFLIGSNWGKSHVVGDCNRLAAGSCNRLHRTSRRRQECAKVRFSVVPRAVGGMVMLDMRISRRAALLGGGAVAAWLSSPARALLQAAAEARTPAFINDLIGRMTLEEKAGQLQLMASAEGGGEDVLLGRLFAAARVQGFQGGDLKSTEHLLSCIKHFAAYGAAESGLDYNVVDMSEMRLREVYLQPYKAGFDAGALSAMASFNEINGVPSTGNPWLMTDLLRGEWGFQGFVVSDYTGDEEMIAAGFAKDARDAARLAFLAGVDMSMQSGLYRQHLPGLVRSGAVPQAKLDESVRRGLALKDGLGLFA